MNNLNSDFFFKRIIDTRVVEKLLGADAAATARGREITRGRARLRGGLQPLPARHRAWTSIPDPTCRGKPWVRPITEIDVYRYFYKLALLASSGVAIDGIGGAQPPTPGAGGRRRCPLAEQLT